MRNLELLNTVQLPVLEAINGSQCMCVDCDTGTVYTATSTQIAGVDPSQGQVTGFISLVEGKYLPADGSGRVVGIQYLPDQQSVCVATSTGNLVLWNVMIGQLECVGTVESGLTAMSWSPDLELLVLTTGQETLIMMTREFDPITEKSLHSEEFGASQFVTVGWGKKETQFHGSEGKEAAHRKAEPVKPALPWDDRQPCVCWRGDGQFFVISTISQETGARRLRVWDRECDHQFTSENVDGIENTLAWKPTGSLIASTQRKPNKHDVVFFEKNGLRHGEFTLPFDVKEVKVIELMWNLDSTILAVWCEDLLLENIDTIPKSYLQLWTMGNYHWYLKESLHFPGEKDKQVAAVVWDPEQAYRLHVICNGGKYLQYTWSWATHFSQDGTVAVIDGNRLLMTPMHKMIVPPPMSAFYLLLPTAVNQVVFCSHGNNSDVAVMLVNNQIAIYSESDTKDESIKFDGAGGNGFVSCCKTPSLKGLYSIDGLPTSQLQYPYSLHHLVWLTSDLFLFCCTDPVTGQHSVLYSAAITEDKMVVRTRTVLTGYVYKMAVNPETKTTALQHTDGSVFKYDFENDVVIPWKLNSGVELSFPIPCHQMAVCQIGGEEVVLGLTSRYRFYVNNTEVASNCTSFAIHREFLLLSTLSHTVRCISRLTKVEVLPTLSDGKAHPFDESIRRVERGSRIVCVVPEDTKLVLQMPRGNLETVHPRALVLSAVRKYLDSIQFKDAMMLMRKHRINMNLLYDHNPQSFLQNIKSFVQQINNVNHFNLFLTDLQEEDVTMTMYTAAYNRSPPSDTDEKLNKVDMVCDSIRKALIDTDENRFILSILTTYVKKTVPELEAALLLVKSLRDNPSKDYVISPQEALKYLLFLVDVNEMFDVALGTYDFDLVLMVAEKSQKDPKEYIAFLNQLRRLEGPYQHYTIDKHLKRYKRALINISKCPDHFEECLSLIKDHRLYTDALKLYTPSSKQFKDIAKQFGDYLSERKRYEEAGVTYVKAEEFELALLAYQSSSNWRQVFCMAARLKYTQDSESDLARKVATQLKDQKNFYDAAVVLDQYAGDAEEAIVCLIDGCQWEEALRLMYKHGRTDFIETNLKSALIDSFDHQMETLEAMQAEFDKYRKRLAVVREEKEKARLEYLESGGGYNDADADLFSDASSATGVSVQSSNYSSRSQQSSSTMYSKISGRSLKNQRKAEHKKWKLKEGSQYEDFALIAALSKNISTADEMKGEIRALVQVLVQFFYDKQATTLQQTYEKFLSRIESGIPEIWPEDTDDSAEPTVLGPTATANTIAQAVQRGATLKSQEKLDPIIKNPPTLRKEVKWKLHILETRDT